MTSRASSSPSTAPALLSLSSRSSVAPALANLHIIHFSIVSVLDDLKEAITSAVEQYKETNIPLAETASVSRVCYIIERILQTGLKGMPHGDCFLHLVLLSTPAGEFYGPHFISDLFTDY